MKQMKKILTGILVLCMVFGLCACGGTDKTEDDGQKDNTENSQLENDEADDSTSDSSKEEDSEEDNTAVFQVKVVDEGGNPVSGVIVQVCNDVCMPGKTEDDGVAAFNMEITDGCKLSILSCPEGYEYTGASEIYLESGITEYEVEINATE